jgi:hypothetical protein
LTGTSKQMDTSVIGRSFFMGLGLGLRKDTNQNETKLISQNNVNF